MVMEYVPGIPLLRPYIDPDNQGFWEGVKQHRLVFQKCKGCGLFVNRPRPMCPRCLSTEKGISRRACRDCFPSEKTAFTSSGIMMTSVCP